MSTFAWLDSSDDERRRVLDAIEKLKENDSRDELGLATIRDGFANELFPGTGTLQTRAGYFLFVPWMYTQLHRKKIASRDVATAARREEVKLIGALLESEDTAGVLGRIAREKLKRLPSSVYWNGLRAWRIFERAVTIDEYHRQFELFREPPEGARDDDRQLVSGSSRRDWHSGLPPPPAEFPRKASFVLSKNEREYLTERILLTQPRSLLAWMLRRAKSLDGDAPWEHPQAAEFPADIQKTIAHAQCFSEAMYGAPHLYNLMLAEKAGAAKSELVQRYTEGLVEWSDSLKHRHADLAHWSLSEFWKFTAPMMRVSRSTVAFVQNWVELRGWEKPDGLAQNPLARKLIEERERQLKGARARLHNQRALELWGQDSGIGRLVYRWRSAKIILADLRPELAHAQP